LHRITRSFADFVNQRLHHSVDGLLLRESHFDIDLGELRLAVGAKILVAEAANNLEILVEAAEPSAVA